jgi:hypothetical protein
MDAQNPGREHSTRATPDENAGAAKWRIPAQAQYGGSLNETLLGQKKLEEKNGHEAQWGQ